MAKRSVIARHTIRPVLAGTVAVLRVLSRRPGQSAKMSRLGIQSARIVPHSGVARLSAARGRPINVPPFPHLKFAYNNLKCIKTNVNSVNTCTGRSYVREPFR